MNAGGHSWNTKFVEQYRGQRGSQRQLLNLLTGLHLKGLRQAICYLFNKPQFCCGKDSHELNL